MGLVASSSDHFLQKEKKHLTSHYMGSRETTALPMSSGVVRIKKENNGMKIPYKNLKVRCSFCRRNATRDFSTPPEKDTPPEDIAITYGDRSISFLCNNPTHGIKYTIQVQSDAEADSMRATYGLKKP